MKINKNINKSRRDKFVTKFCNFGGIKQRTMKKDNEVLSSYSETTVLPDGTELKIIVENYKDRLHPLNIATYCQARVDYKKLRGTRFIGPEWSHHLSEDEMKQHVQYVKDKIKENPENFKFQHAPK